MRTILALVIAVSILGFLAFHKYSNVRCAKLGVQIEAEREKNDELRKKITLLEQKMQLEALKMQELMKKLEAANMEDKKDKELEEQKRLAEEKRKRQEMIAAKEAALLKLRKELESMDGDTGVREVDASAIVKRMNAVKSKINSRNNDLQSIEKLIGNVRFTCFDMCINGTDVKFERKMTRTCHVTVSGGIYFCEHYDMTGSDFCVRHRRHHKNWKFPNRYRDDHDSAVRYLCRAHKTVWDKNTADSYMTTYRNSRAIISSRMRFRSEIASLRRELSRLEAEYAAVMKKNKNIEIINRKKTSSLEFRKAELNKKIEAFENEIGELKK